MAAEARDAPMSSRRTVQIPIVQPGGRSLAGDGAEDRLIEVYTQHYAFDPLTKQEEAASREVDAKARDKDWDRVAAPLRKVGLYQAGCAAASAVRKLGIRQPLTALYQRVSRLAWIEGQRLQPAGAQGPSEGRSAELGLALVLLMCASGSRAPADHRDRRARRPAARRARGRRRGAAGRQPAGQAPPGQHARPPPGPARGRRGRRGAVLHPAPVRAGRRAGSRSRAWPRSRRLKELGVRVVPVERLSEAAAELKALRARHLFHDRVAQALVGGPAAGRVHRLRLVGAAAAADRDDLPARRRRRRSMPEPYRVCFTKDGGFYPMPLGRAGPGAQHPGRRDARLAGADRRARGRPRRRSPAGSGRSATTSPR